MKDPRRWLMVAGAAVILPLALVYEWRRPKLKAPHSECLSHPDCLSDERCYVVPASDGFATSGRCRDTCSESLQCAAGFECAEVADADQHVIPTEHPKAGSARQKICVPLGKQ